MQYKNIHDWITECRSIVREDLDNLILFSGPEGVGKSTVAFQVFRAIDPEFTAQDVDFTIPDFIRGCAQHPRYRARLGDESLLNHRKGMHGTTIDMLDFLQVCRGLNLHMGICFPHPEMLDGAIKDFRVRWNIHVPYRGTMMLRTRIKREVRTIEGLKPVFSWQIVGAWRTTFNTGPLWKEYLERKESHMRSMAAKYMGEGSDVPKKSRKKDYFG